MLGDGNDNGLFQLGLFDPKADQPYFNLGLEVVDSPEHQQLALEAARQVRLQPCTAFCASLQSLPRPPPLLLRRCFRSNQVLACLHPPAFLNSACLIPPLHPPLRLQFRRQLCCSRTMG